MTNKNAVMSTPRHVEIAVTGKCNLHCKYCFYANEIVGRRDLPKDRWLTFFNELGTLNVMGVTLTGGEPFLRKDLFDLIDAIIDNRMRYEILSNGTLINEGMISKFNVGKRRLRLNYIQISVDGSKPEIHNKSRPDSFNRVMDTLRLLHHEGFPCAVRVTINQHNIDDLENIVSLLLDDIGLQSISTDEANFCGKAAENPADIILTPEQRKETRRLLYNLSQKYTGRINAQSGPLIMEEHLRRIDESLSRHESCWPDRGFLSACGCAYSKISILHDGTIVPCHYLSEMSMGEIGITPLQDVWLSHQYLLQLRERVHISLDTLESCKDCSYRGFCTGGCPSVPYKLYGSVIDRNIYSCYRIAKGEEVYAF